MRKQKDFAENRQTLGIIQTSLVSALSKGDFEPSEPIWFNTLAMCRFRPLSHTSISFRVQRYNRLMKSFFVAKENLVFFRKNIIMLRYRGLSTVPMYDRWGRTGERSPSCNNTQCFYSLVHTNKSSRVTSDCTIPEYILCLMVKLMHQYKNVLSSPLSKLKQKKNRMWLNESVPLFATYLERIP